MSEKNKEINVKELMENIRKQIRQDIAADNCVMPEFRPRTVDFAESENIKSGALAHCEHLLFLNRNHSVTAAFNPLNISSHRKGILGKAIVFLKRKLAFLIRDSILKDYLLAEQEFLVHLVRHLNFNSRYVDARDFDLFWQIIHKIDTDVAKALERIERISDQMSGETVTVRKIAEDSVAALSNSMNQQLGSILPEQGKIKAELAAIESAVRGMERILTVFSSANTANTKSSAQPVSIPDLSYVLLENRFRGAESEIAERQKFYTEYFKSVSKPVLDVGCGRGEMLEAFSRQGIKAKGIDMDPAMITLCKAKGLEAEQQDLISYLSSCENGSLGGLIALQVVEHLPRQILLDFIRLAASKVTAGGIIILETINPTSVTALSSNYFRDPTHVFPQHPDTLGFLVNGCGLELTETMFLAPIPEAARLKALKKEIYMTPKWNEMVDLFNHNVDVLNNLLYGYQDFCVIAKVPVAG